MRVARRRLCSSASTWWRSPPMPLTSLRFTWAAPPSRNRDSEFAFGTESCLNFTVITFCPYSVNWLLFCKKMKTIMFTFLSFWLSFQLTTLCLPPPVVVWRSLAPTMATRKTFSSGIQTIFFTCYGISFVCQSVHCAVFCFSFFGVETEVDDPQVFVPPAYCEGVSFEEAPDDHSFFDLFHDWRKHTRWPANCQRWLRTIIKRAFKYKFFLYPSLFLQKMLALSILLSFFVFCNLFLHSNGVNKDELLLKSFLMFVWKSKNNHKAV